MFFGGEKTHLCRPQDGLVTPFLHQKLAMNKASESESCFIFHGFSGVAAGGWLWVGGDGSDIHLTLDFDFRHFFRILDGMIFFVFFWKSLKKKKHVQDIRFSLPTNLSYPPKLGRFFSVDDFSEIPRVGSLFGMGGIPGSLEVFFLMMRMDYWQLGFSFIWMRFFISDLKVGSWTRRFF